MKNRIHIFPAVFSLLVIFIALIFYYYAGKNIYRYSEEREYIYSIHDTVSIQDTTDGLYIHSAVFFNHAPVKTILRGINYPDVSFFQFTQLDNDSEPEILCYGELLHTEPFYMDYTHNGNLIQRKIDDLNFFNKGLIKYTYAGVTSRLNHLAVLSFLYLFFLFLHLLYKFLSSRIVGYNILKHYSIILFLVSFALLIISLLGYEKLNTIYQHLRGSNSPRELDADVFNTRFYRAKIFSSLLMIFSAFIFFWSRKILETNPLFQKSNSFSSLVKSWWSKYMEESRFVLLTHLFLAAVILLFTYKNIFRPITGDEVAKFSYFSQYPLRVGFLEFRLLRVFYGHLIYILFGNSVFMLRIIVPLAFLLTIPLSYYFFKYFFSAELSLLGTVIFILFAPYYHVYAYLLKEGILSTCLFLAMFLLSRKYSGGDRYSFIPLCLSVIFLGILTPVSLYIFFQIFIFWVLSSRKYFKPLLKFFISSGIIIFLIFIPHFILNGVKTYTIEIEAHYRSFFSMIKNFPNFFIEFTPGIHAEDFTKYVSIIFWLLLIIGGIVWNKERSPKIFFLFLSLFFLIPVYFFVHHSYPPVRVCLYYYPVLFLFFLHTLSYVPVFKNRKTFSLILFLPFFIFLFIKISNFSFINNQKSSFNELYNFINKNSDGQNVFLQNDPDFYATRFYFKRAHVASGGMLVDEDYDADVFKKYTSIKKIFVIALNYSDYQSRFLHRFTDKNSEPKIVLKNSDYIVYEIPL